MGQNRVAFLEQTLILAQQLPNNKKLKDQIPEMLKHVQKLIPQPDGRNLDQVL